MRIISRLDVKGKNLIKGINLEGLRVVGDPNKYAIKYYEQGADEILSDYGFNGKKITWHSCFGGRFPNDLNTIFPWESFFSGIAKGENFGFK